MICNFHRNAWNAGTRAHTTGSGWELFMACCLFKHATFHLHTLDTLCHKKVHSWQQDGKVCRGSPLRHMGAWTPSMIDCLRSHPCWCWQLFKTGRSTCTNCKSTFFLYTFAFFRVCVAQSFWTRSHCAAMCKKSALRYDSTRPLPPWLLTRVK